MGDVLLLGCGLIGTSIGLALARDATASGTQVDVLLHDTNPDSLSAAALRGAGRPWDGEERARLVICAVPPGATAATLAQAQSHDLGSTYTHVCSVQSLVQAEVERLGCDLSAIVGGHPMAGRETSGPAGASHDLFAGRPWAVCPSVESSHQALEAVLALVAACGGEPLVVEPGLHDASVALLSHLPHLTSAALAGLLSDGAGRNAHPAPLAGPGLADTTRLAAGNAELWTQILVANAAHISPVLRDLVHSLSGLADELDRIVAGDESADQARDAVHAFLLRGNQGRAMVPLKRGAVAERFATVRVEVADRPGTLAALLGLAGQLGVNVEDVRVEHEPGRPRGLVDLAVAAHSVDVLSDALLAQGWTVLDAPV